MRSNNHKNQKKKTIALIVLINNYINELCRFARAGGLGQWKPAYTG